MTEEESPPLQTEPERPLWAAILLSFLDKLFLFAVLFFIGWIVHTEIQKAQVNAEAQREFRNQQFATVKEVLDSFRAYINSSNNVQGVMSQLIYALENDASDAAVVLYPTINDAFEKLNSANDRLVANETDIMMYLGMKHADTYADFTESIIFRDADMRRKVWVRLRELGVAYSKERNLTKRQQMTLLQTLQKFTSLIGVETEDKDRIRQYIEHLRSSIPELYPDRLLPE